MINLEVIGLYFYSEKPETWYHYYAKGPATFDDIQNGGISICQRSACVNNEIVRADSWFVYYYNHHKDFTIQPTFESVVSTLAQFGYEPARVFIRKRRLECINNFLYNA